MRAVVTNNDKTASVKEKDIPPIRLDEVLVKIVAVSLNPTDWKHVAFLSPPGVIVGCDYAGVVEKVGATVTHVQIGDKIGGLVHGSRHSHTGSFAEYAAAVADVTFKKPDHLSFEETTVFGVGCLTAVACLYQRLELPTPLKPATDPHAILIWSGATSVGQYAIQLAKLSNLTVITTASPKNHDLLKSLGADHTFDYRDPDVVNKIKEVTHNSLAYGFDCVGENDSPLQVASCMGAGGGKVVMLSPPPKKCERSDVKFIFELLYSCLGQDFSLGAIQFKAVPEDRAFIANFIKNEFNQLLADKKLKPNVLKPMEGGIDKITEGLAYLRSGKASAEKLVYHIQDA